MCFPSPRTDGATYGPREGNYLRNWGHNRPVQLTHGPLNYSSPAPGADGKNLFVIGGQEAGELVRWDSGSGEFVRFLGGIPAYSVSFSRDGQWVAYLRFPEATLWRMRPDGSAAKQLTFAPMHLLGFEWSPDGSQIAFLADDPGSPFKIYLIPSQGGSPEELLPQRHERQGIPT